MDRLVHDLAQSQAHGYAAEDVGVYVGESPAAHEQIDHSSSGGSRGFGKIRASLDNDPGFGRTIGRGGIAGLHNRTREPIALVEAEAQRYIQGALDAVDADFAVALRGMTIAATEERARIVDGEI